MIIFCTFLEVFIRGRIVLFINSIFFFFSRYQHPAPPPVLFNCSETIPDLKEAPVSGLRAACPALLLVGAGVVCFLLVIVVSTFYVF